MTSIHLLIPDSRVLRGVLIDTVEGVTAALTVSGWRNTCLSMGTCTLVIYAQYQFVSFYHSFTLVLGPHSITRFVQLGSLEGHIVSCQM